MIPVCHPQKTHAARGLCRACYSREWDARHPGWRAGRRAAKRADNLQRFGRSVTPSDNAQNRASRLRREYGITVEGYDLLVDQQGGVCALCLKPCVTGKRLTIDHDHATGIVRGLLCNKCNRAIGLLGDNVELVERVVEYLRR